MNKPLEVYRPAEVISIGAPGVRLVLVHQLRWLERAFAPMREKRTTKGKKVAR